MSDHDGERRPLVPVRVPILLADPYSESERHSSEEAAVTDHPKWQRNVDTFPSFSSYHSLPPPPPPHQHHHRQSNKVSSLDFERVVNDYSIQATKDRLFLINDQEDHPLQLSLSKQEGECAAGYGTTTPVSPPPPAASNPNSSSTSNKMDHAKKSKQISVTRWILSAIVGLVTGLLTIFIVHITGSLIHLRIQTLDRMAQDEAYPVAMVFAGYTSMNLLLALTASMLCVYVAPEGTGSGIPEVKAYLNGVRVKKFTSWRLLAVKIVGTILSVSSSLTVGMEGPLIHIGAIVGASFTKSAALLSRFLLSQLQLTSPTTMATHNNRFLSALWVFMSTNLAHFAIDVERRDLVSIGASVGLAASFGAPIGGLLFILDDISSFFSKNMFLRTLVANAIGTFCLAAQSGNLSTYSIINLGSYSGGTNTNDIFLEQFAVIPLFLIVAIGGGILGGIFCATFEYQKDRWIDRWTSPGAKFLHVAMVSLLTSACMFGLPYLGWACKDIPIGSPNYERGRQFFCAPGQVNEMATIMWGSRDDAIKRILSDPTQFKVRTLWSIGILFYALMTITIGSTLPSGIFTPTVLIGASLGGAAGLMFDEWFDHGIPVATFALLGVAAMLAGIQRSTVSICVILVEGTGEIKVLLPVIIVVLVARHVASLIHSQGFYETSMTLKQYPYMDHEQKPSYDILKVKDIMSSPPIVVWPVIRASHLVNILQTTSHNGYPVVDRVTQKFRGLVRRDQIVALLECGVFQESDRFDDNGSALVYSTTHSDNSPCSVASTTSPRPGIADSPMMNWAYHIKDDRYDYLKSARVATTNIQERGVPFTIEMDNRREDEFDRREMIWNIRGSLRGDDSLPPLGRISVLPSGSEGTTSINQDITGNRSFVSLSSSRRGHRPTRSTLVNDLSTHSTATGSQAPTGYAEIGVDDSDNLIVTWLNPECHNLFVNVSLVMNQGAYCVPEHLPVSKARNMFTALGLRHVVVVGGKTGGEVVGIFTRGNLLDGFIRERVGFAR